MSAKRRIKGEMRERLDDLAEAAAEIDRNPSIWSDNTGCWWAAMGFFLAAIAILGVLYVTGVIDYDFTKTPEERAAESEQVDAGADAGSTESDAGGEAASADVQEPGEPYMEGRHYAIYGIGEGGASRVYTFELLGEGDSGEIRVWEDETGRGTFTIADGVITIQMERMVPAEKHEIYEPNTFTGPISADASSFSGEWSREGWGGVPGEVALSGEWSSISFEAKRL